MKVFITGGTGFIGGHVIDNLINRGHDVLALKRSALSKPRISLRNEPRWIIRSLDNLHPEDFQDIDLVLHLAAHSANYPYDTLKNCIQWNLAAPLSAFRAAYEAGIDKYLVIGSCFEYGLSSNSYEFIPANAPLFPLHTYPTSKAAASVALTQWAYQNKVSMSLLRIFHVYGPGEQAGRLWPALVEASEKGIDIPMTLGEQVRDFISVQDLASVLTREIELLHKRPLTIKIANLGSGQPRTIRSFAEEIWSDLRCPGSLKFGELPYRPHEIMRCVPDLSPFYILK